MPARDDLSRRLQRAAGPAPDPEPALARIAGRLDRHRPARARMLAVAAVVVVLAAGWVALRSPVGDTSSVRTDQSSTTPSSTATSSTAPASTVATTAATAPIVTVPLDPPPGYVTVADGEGNPVGYMPTNDDLEPEPTLDLGTGPALSGRRVVDAAGNPIGYMIVEIGFITNDQAADPAEIDRLVAEHRAWEQEAIEEFGR